MHIITSAEHGGSQNILFNLCKLDSKNHHKIISLKKVIKIDKDFEEIDVYGLNINLFNFFFKLIKLIFIIYKFNPLIIQSWLYHSDFITIFLKPFMPKKKIYWNIRSSNLYLKKNFFTILIRTINSFFSYIIPKKIIFCSKESLKTHKRYLFNQKIFCLIYNGVNQNKFKIINKIHKKNLLNIGCNARFHPMKDHDTLFRALILLKEKNIKFKLHLVGENIHSINLKSTKLLDDIKIYELGSDMNDFFNQLDIHVLPSLYGESFSNVLLESMSCGIYNLVTDVGNNIEILGNFGAIFKKKDEIDLSIKIINFIQNKKNMMSQDFKNKQRNYILKNYSLTKMISNYNLIWS